MWKPPFAARKEGELAAGFKRLSRGAVHHGKIPRVVPACLFSEKSGVIEGCIRRGVERRVSTPD